MSARGWLVRDLLVRVISDAPAAPAAWLSVGRRAAVVGALFLIGVATDSLPIMVIACFGALQVGILEAALPLRSLIRFMGAIVLTTTAVTFIAMIVGGTWWMVVFVSIVAYLFGSTARFGPRAATIGVTALAMAVIFSGMPQPPETALRNAGLVFLGAATQGLFAIMLWKPERLAFVRRAMAIKIESDIRLIQNPWIPTEALVRTHAATDSLHEVLADAQLPPKEDSRIRRVFSDAIELTRALVAWQMIRRPGDQVRLDVAMMINGLQRKMSRGSKRMVVPTTPLIADGYDDEPTMLVQRSLAALSDDVDVVVLEKDAGPRALHRLAAPVDDRPATKFGEVVRALLPGGKPSRHGVRMAVGLAIAETVTMLLTFEHSFWLPLTVVFTLKPDWAFTALRGITRTLGNLAAVVILPIVLGAIIGFPIALAVLLMVLAATLYRWFFGNYMVASFGLAGSVLLLDYTLNPDANLFFIRIAAAIGGALLSLAVVYFIPNWTSDQAPERVDELEQTVRELELEVRRAQDGQSDASGDDLDEAIIRVRHSVNGLEAASSAALLEPRPTGDPVALAMVLGAGTRMLMDLLAMGYVLLASRHLPAAQGPQASAMQAQQIRCREARVDLDQALSRYRFSISR